MKKRNFLHAALTGAVASAGPTAIPAYAQNGPKASSGPILLTVSGLIGAGNRGALDPALDQMMAKQKIGFSKARAFDFAMLTAMTAVTIRPTLEYDNKQHALRGPTAHGCHEGQWRETHRKDCAAIASGRWVRSVDSRSRGSEASVHSRDAPG
jgi:hypothetical protein